VKENAPDLLRWALSRLPVDVVCTGDYQPAERKFEVSRRMLEVCLELGFPVSVLERSPLVLRDLDLLKEINTRAPSVVFFSMISAPDSPTYDRVREMENLAPHMEKRYEAMEQIAKAGILTGISMMPILPGLCDTDENLEATVRWTANHGGRFVIAGGLTLADQQRDYFFGVLRDRFRMEMKVKALSAEAKSSAGVLGSLPPGVMLMTYMSSPEYIMPLFATTFGNVLLLVGAVWMFCGMMVMKKMINFKF